jgi:excisionase family DNA binding protein
MAAETVSALLTLDEAAKRINRSPATLRYWVTRGQNEGPKSFRSGRRRMFRVEAVDAWIAEQEAKSQELDAAKSA